MVNKNLVIKYVLCVVVVAILLSLSTMASMQNIVFPFAIPIALALVFCNVKSYIVAPIFFLASLINGVAESNLIISGYSSCVILFAGLLTYKNREIKWWIGCIFVLLSELAYLYFNAYLGTLYLECALTVVLSMLSFICAYHFFKSFRSKPLVFRFSLDEAICAFFILLVASSGIANINIPYFNLYHFLGITLILLSAYIFKKNQTIIISLIYGLGFAINTLEIGYIALFASIALAVVLLKSEFKVYSIFIALIVDVLFGLYFETNIAYNLTSILEAVLASLIFICVPNKFIQNLSGYISSDAKSFGVKSILDRNKTTMQNKLIELSNVFEEMDIVFRKMIKGVLPINDAKDMLASESCQKVCTDCKDRAKCFRSKNNIQGIYYDLVTIGFERGRVTLLDIPPNMTSICGKTSQILIVINQLINQYKQYANMITNLDSSRILIAEQLSGVAHIMKDLSRQIDEDIVFDNVKESKIIDELTFNDIICNDAVVYQKDNYTTNVNILVRNQDTNSPLIKAIVSKVCGNLLDVKDVAPSEISGWSMVTLSTASTYDILFGYAGTSKSGEEVSGDNYSLLRINDSKFMMAVCDGMGSGSRADKTSELAISLVENFYKAGFDNDIILNCVNKLLALNNEENFTALDLCVIDLKNCFADFIKLGAPVGFIKHKETTTQINGGALPIGILDEMKPAYYKTVLNDQDLIVLCSDGVTDAFQKSENLKNFINNIQTLHPQKLADEILKKALSLNLGVANDDMTIIVGRVFQKFA
ncbi:MAG: SpoIIE family protein phosphatase [Clostridia bacterium]|nr:SpoIIE family protein phosphatase [Clostridia bacterium]